MLARSLGGEDPLEGEMATHSSTLLQKIPWTEEAVGYSPWGRKESDMTEHACMYARVFTTARRTAKCFASIVYT